MATLAQTSLDASGVSMSTTDVDSSFEGYQLPNFHEVNDVLQPIQPRWYELFLHMGLKRDVLERLCAEHPYDDHSSLIEAISIWLKRKEPIPTWEYLVEIVENVLMEGNVAYEIKTKFCCNSRRGNKVEDGGVIHQESLQSIDHGGIAFMKLLSTISEKLGSTYFPELQHFLLHLKCPDGSALIKSDYFCNLKTVKDLLISLVSANLCTARDVDVLIHTLSGLKRGDLLTLISAYVPQVTVGNPLGAMTVRDGSVMLKVSLPDALKQIDLGIVSSVKLDLCRICNIQDQPFLLQYIGWKTNPVTMFFQFPIACMSLLEKGLHSGSLHELTGNGIHCIAIHYKNATVCYTF